MKGLFCMSSAKNNEEYKMFIKTRMKVLIMMFFIGVVTFAVSVLAEFQWSVAISDRMLGVYTGAGTGLAFASVILWIKNKLLLNNEEKLKENRISSSDERIKEINSKAFRIASVILLVALYGVGLIGGLFYPILIEVLLGCVGVFLVSYVIAYKVYEKRM